MVTERKQCVELLERGDCEECLYFDSVDGERGLLSLYFYCAVCQLLMTASARAASVCLQTIFHLFVVYSKPSTVHIEKSVPVLRSYDTARLQ